MERRKNVLVCIFIIVSMILLTLSAYATSGDNSVDMKDGSSKIYSMVLPTDCDFTIDPYGLTMLDNTKMSLNEILNHPVGLVTSEAVTLNNTNDVGVSVGIEVYLESEIPIRVAKTKDEAKKSSDLYVEILPVGISNIYSATPVTVLNNGIGAAQPGNLIKFKHEKSGEENSKYEFMISGYANPNSPIWKDAAYTQSQKPIKLCMKFSFEYEELDESSEESESSSTEDSSTEDPSSSKDPDSQESSSEKPTDGETTTVPATVNNVTFSNGAFALKIPKSEVSARPTDISLIYENEEYNLRYYAVVQITEDKDYYIITVTDFPEGEGVCPLKVFAGNKLIYDKATVTFP